MAAVKWYRSGNVLIYFTLALVPLAGFISLAVDLGRTQLAQTQLQSACDAAARFGIARFHATQGNIAQTIVAAQTAANDNLVDGAQFSLADNGTNSAGIQFVQWDCSSRSFTTLSGNQRSTAYAIRVAASREVPTFFGRLVGIETVTIRGESVVSLNTGQLAGDFADLVVPAAASPWWAQVPRCVEPVGPFKDDASTNAPVEVNLPNDKLDASDIISFSNISGVTWPSEWFGF